MNQKGITRISMLVVVLSMALAACAPAAVETPVVTETAGTGQPSGPVTLTVTGLVGAQLDLADADLQAMDVVTVTAEHPKNGPGEYTGVRLNDLLDAAQVQDAAVTLTLIAIDGYSYDVDLAAVRACTDCLLGFGETAGSYLAVMPGQEGKAWVKDVVSIEVK